MHHTAAKNGEFTPEIKIWNSCMAHNILPQISDIQSSVKWNLLWLSYSVETMISSELSNPTKNNDAEILWLVNVSEKKSVFKIWET